MLVAPVHTSDRILFKRCRRKWGWSSPLRDAYQPKESASPLWLGIGFHYAMEDFHGYNLHGHPSEALKAFVNAYRKATPKRLPPDWTELLATGIDMCNYYVTWLQGRSKLETYWVDGVPQVEVKFEIPIPVDPSLIERYNQAVPENRRISKVVYAGTIDRVIIDSDGNLWELDFKTAKTFGTMHYETDPQISSYLWAGTVLYNKPFAGFIYQQHKKTLPDKPRILKDGTISVAQNQSTTRTMYREALIEKYGSVQQAPGENIKYLNTLAAQEDENGDKYIIREKVYRNQHQLEAEGAKILLEVEDMLNPNLPLYPNPTRDCSWDCPFQGACLMLDSGTDFEGELAFVADKYQSRDENWRNYLWQDQHNP